MAHSRRTHKAVSRHTMRARKSGRALAKTARHRHGATMPGTVDGYVESVVQFVEASQELQEVPELE